MFTIGREIMNEAETRTALSSPLEKTREGAVA